MCHPMFPNCIYMRIKHEKMWRSLDLYELQFMGTQYVVSPTSDRRNRNLENAADADFDTEDVSVDDHITPPDIKHNSTVITTATNHSLKEF